MNYRCLPPTKEFLAFIGATDGTEPCAQEFADPTHWDTDIISSPKLSRSLCEGCHVLDKCMEYAIANYEIGTWGGTTTHQRNRLRGERKRSRAAA